MQLNPGGITKHSSATLGEYGYRNGLVSGCINVGVLPRVFGLISLQIYVGNVYLRINIKHFRCFRLSNINIWVKWCVWVKRRKRKLRNERSKDGVFSEEWTSFLRFGFVCFSKRKLLIDLFCQCDLCLRNLNAKISRDILCT